MFWRMTRNALDETKVQERVLRKMERKKAEAEAEAGKEQPPFKSNWHVEKHTIDC